MQTSKCVNCGADIDYATKFCRQCGRPVDPSEWTTRKLEEPSRFESPTRLANSWPTSPTYLPPDAMPPQAPVTSSIESAGQKKTVIVLATIVALLVIALSALAILMFVRQADEAPRAMSTPTAPTAPKVPGVPTPPPIPNGATTTISQDLIYPGAQVTMEVKGEEKAKMVQLNTSDSFDKVIDWYVKKIKPTKHVTIPGGNAVLKGDGIAVMIMNDGEVTSILITQGED